jgi:hypothetical protein
MRAVGYTGEDRRVATDGSRMGFSCSGLTAVWRYGGPCECRGRPNSRIRATNHSVKGGGMGKCIHKDIVLITREQRTWRNKVEFLEDGSARRLIDLDPEVVTYAKQYRCGSCFEYLKIIDGRLLACEHANLLNVERETRDWVWEIELSDDGRISNTIETDNEINKKTSTFGIGDKEQAEYIACSDCGKQMDLEIKFSNTEIIDLLKLQGFQPRTDPEFQSGDRVLHQAFGEGSVIQSRIEGGDEKVTVVFDADKKTRTLSGVFAPMTRVEPQTDSGGGGS